MTLGHACCQPRVFTLSLFTIRSILPQLDIAYSSYHLVAASTSDSGYEAFLIIFLSQKRICKGKQNHFWHKQQSFILRFDYISMLVSRNDPGIQSGIADLPKTIVKSERKKSLESSLVMKYW